MSKSVLIPSTEKPMWECEINGKVYAYAAGLITTVPDEVASVIENIYGQIPLPAPGPEDGQVWMYKDGTAGWQTITIPEPEKELPAFSNGKWLKSSASGCSWESLPTATTSQAGIVNKATNVSPISGFNTDVADVAATINQILDSLVDAGLMAPEDI